MGRSVLSPALLLAVTLGAPGPAPGESRGPRTIPVGPPNLEAVVDSLRAADGELRDVTLQLSAGTYDLVPGEYIDPSCGNCEDPATPVPATVGLRISGRRVVIVGAGPGQTVLRTHAGYGLLFDDCRNCRLETLTVTGGVRDPDARATDAAVVVRNGRLDVTDCEIRDNVGNAEVVRRTTVGIIGICGREGSDVRVTGTRVLRNSWDGIALYRDSRATITGCVIDGIDAARGSPEAVVARNVIRDVGACGIPLTLPPGAGGSCTGNLVVGSGRDERYDDPGYYCTQCPIAAQAVPDGYVLADNLCYDSRRAVPDSLAAHDTCREVDEAEMQEARRRFAATVERDDVRRESRALADVRGR